jgi:hypothetical protein
VRLSLGIGGYPVFAKVFLAGTWPSVSTFGPL